MAGGGKPPVGEPVIDRAFRILGAFGPSDRSLSLVELSARAGLPKSTSLRIARALIGCGALERRVSGEFVIGLRLLEVASLAPRGHGLRAAALPYMEDLHYATRQHVLLAVPDRTEAVLVERLSARGAGRVLYRVGGRVPFHATGVGMCLLAFAPAHVLDEVANGDLAISPENRNLSQGELRTALAKVRSEGVAIVRRPQPTPMTSVAAPILGRSGHAIAAVSVVGSAAHTEPAALRHAVMAVARSISRAVQAEGLDRQN